MPKSEEPPPGKFRSQIGTPVSSAVWIFSTCGMLVAIMALSSLLVPIFSRMLKPSAVQLERDRSLVQAKQIYNACQAFAAVRGRLPAVLEELVPDFLPDRRALVDPGHPEEGEVGYFYYGSGSTGTEPPESVFLASKAETNRLRVVVRFDGVTRLQDMPAKWLRREGRRE